MENPFIPHLPTPKQALFLALDCREAFYGGAAGGGKSDSLLMAGLQFVQEKGYAALLLRKTYQDLAKPEGLMTRAHAWLGDTDAVWHGSNYTWEFPSGATLSFGYLESENDKYQYQGAAYQFIGFDELTQFSESQYRYLFSRLRKIHGIHIPLRMRSGSNPGGVGHNWVKQRFIVEGQRHGRVFVPARLDDNPHLEQESYRESLSELDEVTRLQLERGDWTVNAGGLMFKRNWFEIVDSAPAGCLWCRYWDCAATKPQMKKAQADWTAGALLGRSPEGVWFLKDMRHVQETPLGVQRLVRHTADVDGPEVMIRMEQEGGSAGPAIIDNYARVILIGRDFLGDHPDTNKMVRAKPVSAAAQQGNVKLVRGDWITNFLDEAECFPTGEHDDQIDALSGAMKCLTGGQVFLV